MVTGKRPFQGDSDYSIMAAHLEQKPVAPIEIVAGVPLDLNDIIMMAISKAPEQRFQSADAFHAALRNFAKSMGVPLAAQPGMAKPSTQLAPTATGISVPARPAPTAVPVPPPPSFQPQAGPLPAEYQARPAVSPTMPPTPVMQSQPVPLVPPAPAKSGSRRGLYMALGSVATLLVLAAAVIEGPKLMHSGASNAAPRSETPAEIAPTQSTPTPSTPAPAPAATPSPDAAAQAPVTAPAATPAPPLEPTPTPVRAAVPPPAAVRNTPVQKAAPTPAQAHSPQRAVQQPPLQQPPARPTASPELNELRQEYNQVAIRVGAAKSGLRGLQQQMQRQGLDMRGDMLEAESRMDYLMKESMDSMRAGDAAGSRNNLQMAERSLETIEKFLGR
jgi:serine/threonine-protein kinase